MEEDIKYWLGVLKADNFNKSFIDLVENLIADNKRLDKENQALFEAYNFNDTNLLAKILKEYRKEIKDSIPKSKVREKIEILNNIIDRLDKELAEAYIVREKLGTEGEIDANEQYIYNMEQERSIRHTEKYAYLKLLEEGDK